MATGWKMNGGLRLACNEERWTEVKRQATTAHSFGLDMQLLTPKEAQELWPLMDVVGDVIGAAFCRQTVRPTLRTSPRRWPRARGWPGPRSFEDTKGHRYRDRKRQNPRRDHRTWIGSNAKR